MIKPRPILKKTLSDIQSKKIPPGIALDFGIGNGDETKYLLKHGYKVIAIDNFKEFLTEAHLKIEGTPYQDNLTTIHSNFEDLDWSTIPDVDLFVACFSLGFVQPDQFHDVWKNIVAHIKPGGHFVGQMYTHLYENIQRDGYFIEEHTKLIPFLTKEDILELFHDFDIEYFDKVEALYENEESNSEGIMYSVIAQKKLCSNSQNLLYYPE